MDQELRPYTRLAVSESPGPIRADIADRMASADPLTWFSAERGTLVAAVNACAASGHDDLAWDLSLTMRRFLEMHHHHRDWTGTAATGLAAARRSANPLAEVAMLCDTGEAHLVQDELGAAEAAFTEALEIARSAGDGRAEVHALRGIAIIRRYQGRLDDSMEIARHALGLLARFPDTGIEADVWLSMGSAQHLAGDLTSAEASYRRALDGFTAADDRMNLAIMLVSLGGLLASVDRYTEAEDAFRKSIGVCEELGFASGEGFAYTALGVMYRRIGDLDRAADTLKAALRIVRDHADHYTEGTILVNLGEATRASDPKASRRYLTTAVDLLTGQEIPSLLATALIGLGDTAVLDGAPRDARAAWTRAAGLADPARAAEIQDRIQALALTG